jgi:pyruvate/2-oxoglutarate dehydrogenase complex dihydrolipoamide acyltransferase (E2) component
MLPKIGWLGMPKCRNSIWFAQWCRSNGAEIKANDIIAVIHTPRTQLKIAAPASGFLFWMKKDKRRIQLSDVLGVIVDAL